MSYQIAKEYEGRYVIRDDAGETVASVSKFMPGPMVSVSGQGLYPPPLAVAVAKAMTKLADDIAGKLRKGTVFEPCERHAAMYASASRERRAETMAEGGWAASPCIDGRCQMKPGTDFFTADFVAANPVYVVEQ